jgi:hypothetical protein
MPMKAFFIKNSFPKLSIHSEIKLTIMDQLKRPTTILNCHGITYKTKQNKNSNEKLD